MGEISFERVSKVYPDGTKAVSDLSLRIEDGELMVFVGPSGCGKTTALRMVAGLEEISSGRLRIDGRVVNHALPRDRDIAMVFQNYALYPHMNVYKNMAFALKIAKVDKDEIDRRVREAARILQLTDYLERKPRALSGGQRQRVAMGRAIVREPRAFLMDEPLSNLDAKLRVDMRAEIARIQRLLGVATIYVTHDQVEAMTMGDRVAVLRDGVLQQVDVPQHVYDRPANLFVATFIGSPSMNVVEARLARDRDGVVARFMDSELRVGARVLAERPALLAHLDRAVAMGFRCEDVHDVASAPDAPAGTRLKASVELCESLGSELLAHFSCGAPRSGLPVVEGFGDPDHPALGPSRHLVARLSARSRVRTGDRVELSVDVDQLHFFDLENGAAIFGAVPPRGEPQLVKA